MKKIICFLVIYLLFPNISNAYVDVKNDYFAYEDIVNLEKNNIVLGYPGDIFCPDNYITEEELITIFLRAANIDACQNYNNWPDDYIELGINNGIIADESTVTGEEFMEFARKITILPSINSLNSLFTNGLNSKITILDNIDIQDKFVTRAEACVYINKLINYKDKFDLNDIPQELEIYYSSDENLNISTTINSIEVFDYDSYSGKYLEIIDMLKKGEHPYLKARDAKAKGNKVIAIEFNTTNNTEYGVWTSYKSLMFQDANLVDAFDVDEINKQLENCAYNSILVTPNSNYTVTAFYIVETLPEEIHIDRDITTIYNTHTHEYIDANSFSSIQIKL